MRDGVPANRACATLKPDDWALKAIIARQDDAATEHVGDDLAHARGEAARRVQTQDNDVGPLFAGRRHASCRTDRPVERERRIFETRRLAEQRITLVELAEEFGVSRERVRQIEVSAFEKVQNAVKRRVAAMATPAPLQMR